jgi:hypothetical protein
MLTSKSGSPGDPAEPDLLSHDLHLTERPDPDLLAPHPAKSELACKVIEPLLPGTNIAQ